MTKYQSNKHNYADDELHSALQKEIRRANEKEALYFALEIAHESHSSFSWLKHRLKIIAYEDIGLANTDIVLQVSKAIDDMIYLWDKDNDRTKNMINHGEWEMVLAYIILLLCRTSKSRMVEHFKNYVITTWEIDENPIPIPDYALDKDTTKGCEMKRGYEYFINEGAKLINETTAFEDIYKEKCYNLWKKRKEDKKK